MNTKTVQNIFPDSLDSGQCIIEQTVADKPPSCGWWPDMVTSTPGLPEWLHPKMVTLEIKEPGVICQLATSGEDGGAFLSSIYHHFENGAS